MEVEIMAEFTADMREAVLFPLFLVSLEDTDRGAETSTGRLFMDGRFLGPCFSLLGLGFDVLVSLCFVE